MTDLTELGVRQSLEALERGDCSSRELTLAFLERSQRLEPDVHAYITPTPELALQMAEAADQRRQAWKGEAAPAQPLPGLLGLPVALERRADLERRALHVRFADPGKFRATLHRHRRTAPAGRRGGGDRQDQHR